MTKPMRDFTLVRDLRTIKQTAEEFPIFTEPSLRALISRREDNGFGEVLVRVGGRVYIDVKRLELWVQRQNSG